MKILLTGACGYLGVHVCQRLAGAGFEIRATDRLLSRDLPVAVQVEDLLRRDVCYGLVEGCDAVVHLANHPNARSGDPQRVFGENVTMNMNVFQAAVEAGIRSLLFASSIQVFSMTAGPTPAGAAAVPYLPLDGQAPTCPVNAYALSKVCTEQMLDLFARCTPGLNAVAIRFPAIVQMPAAPAARGANRSPPPANEAFTFLSANDAASLICSILKAKLEGFRVYFPAARGNRLGRPAADVIREFYPNTPLRKPLEKIDSLVDLSAIQRDTGWQPVDNELG